MHSAMAQIAETDAQLAAVTPVYRAQN